MQKISVQGSKNKNILAKIGASKVSGHNNIIYMAKIDTSSYNAFELHPAVPKNKDFSKIFGT